MYKCTYFTLDYFSLLVSVLFSPLVSISFSLLGSVSWGEVGRLNATFQLSIVFNAMSAL